MKRKTLLIFSLLMALLTFCLASCDVESSGFIAGKYVQKNNGNSAKISFSSFKGNDDYKIHTSGDSPKTLKYTGKLDSGDASVYYEVSGEKKELFRIKGGEEVNSSIGDINDTSVKIFFEAPEKCKGGEFTFELE